ncbi:MAG: NAD(P)-dependent alcohol dehydrogenase [Porticoccaceae bacterium]
MKVWEVRKPGGLSNLKLVERPEISPQRGEVLVRWRATSLNYHDYLVVNGAIPVVEGRIPMSDGAGEIVAVGDGVEHWAPGDRVMSLYFRDWQEGRPTPAKTGELGGEDVDGCAVELTRLGAHQVTTVPRHMSFAEAATLPCAGLTAWRGLVVEGGLKAGDTVLVQGTGGMSILALQIAKAAGAYVFATSSSDDKLEQLKALGADEVINYSADASWGKTVFRLAGGGVDHVLDVGGGATIRHSVEAARMGGRIALIGILGGVKGELVFPKLFTKQVRLTGLSVGSAEMQKEMVAAMETAKIRPVIDRAFAFDELVEAFRYQESGAQFGKIVVEH